MRKYGPLLLFFFSALAFSGYVYYLNNIQPTPIRLILDSSRKSYFIGCMEALKATTGINNKRLSTTCHKASDNYYNELAKAVNETN